MGHLMDLFWLGVLAATAGWTLFFSLFNRPQIRGWRNLGVLVGYVLGIAMFTISPWRQSLATWAAMGLLAGTFYLIYELIAYLRLTEKTPDARPKLQLLVHALLLWPVMLPEALEYLLAELGVLKPAPKASSGT
jgi:hypothetical protein